MNLKNQPPIFVPDQFRAEIEKLSKATLMDMLWDLATRCSGDDSLNNGAVIGEIRHTAEIITTYRKRERERVGSWRQRIGARAAITGALTK